MTKKKTMKNIKTSNKFEGGGYFDKVSKNAGIFGLAGGIGSSISGNYTTDNNIGEWMQTAGSLASFIPGPWGAAIGAGLNILGGVAERGFGTSWNQEGIANAENNINSLKGFTSNANSYDALIGELNNINSLNTKVKTSDIGKDGWWSDKAKDKAVKLNKETTAAYNTAMRNVSNTADNIAADTLANLERNYAAFGGPLFAYGGHTHGADFTNGLMHINNGGTHESNPYEGVPISMDQEGNPNLVEEGEVVWNDYVFSNRLKVPKAVRNKYKLRGPKDMTFADAIEKISKESEERPNDPISKRGLDNNLMLLAMEQEKLRPKNNKGNKFNTGGYSGSNRVEPIALTPIQWEVKAPEFKFPKKVTLPAPEKSDSTWMRYAPVIGQGVLAATDLLGLTNKADYTNANAVIDASKKASTYNPVSFKTIGDYMTYNPFDTEYHANQLRAVSGATRRHIMNTSGGNRATAMAGILALDNNTMNQMGDLYRKAAEYNLEQRQKVADFNRATNITNSQGLLQAATANQAADAQAKARGLEGLMKGYTMKEQAKLMSDQAKAANISGLLTSMGDIGRESVVFNMIKDRLKSGVDGPGKENYLEDIFGQKQSFGDFLRSIFG